MADDFREKIKSIGFSRKRGQSNITAVVGDDGPNRGQVVGERTEHWDDRVDAKVTRPVVTVNPALRAVRMDD